MSPCIDLLDFCFLPILIFHFLEKGKGILKVRFETLLLKKLHTSDTDLGGIVMGLTWKSLVDVYLS